MRFKKTFALFTAAIVAFSVSSCSAQQTREASADQNEWPSRVVCDQKSSWTSEITVLNTTANRIQLAAGSIDCYDWSGEGTPATVFSGQIVGGFSQKPFTLEPRDNVNRNWKMRFTDTRTGTVIGTLGAAIERGGFFRVSNPNERKGNGCTEYPIGPDPSKTPSQPYSSVLKYDHLYLWSDGATVYAIQCYSGGNGGSG